MDTNTGGAGGSAPQKRFVGGRRGLAGAGGGGSGLCVPTEEGAGSAARRDAPGAERRRRRRRDLQPFSGAAEAAGGRGRAARPRTRCSGDARRPPRTMAGLLPLLLLLLPAVSAGPGGGEGCSQVPGEPRAPEGAGKEPGGVPGSRRRQAEVGWRGAGVPRRCAPGALQPPVWRVPGVAGKRKAGRANVEG